MAKKEKETETKIIKEKLTKGFISQKPRPKGTTRTQEEIKTHALDLQNYLDASSLSSYSNDIVPKDFTALANNLNQFIQETRRLSDNGIIDIALSEIVNEAIVQDGTEPALRLDLDNSALSDNLKDKIKDEFQFILNMLDFENEGSELFRQFYIDGQINFLVLYNDDNIKEGIKNLIILTPYNFFEYEDPETQEKFYFYANEIRLNFELKEAFKKSKEIFSEEEIARSVSGTWSQDRAVPISYLSRCQKVANQISLLEDSMIIFRITRAPEKRVFYIYTGRLPKTRAEQYVKSLISKYRQKKIYNQTTGTLENQPTTLSVLDDFWFPVGENEKGTKVENLAGQNPDFGQLEDIKYFQKKLFRSLYVPINRLDDEARIIINNTIDTQREELRFIKFISKQTRQFGISLLKLLKLQLISKNIIDEGNWDKLKHSIQLVWRQNSNYFLIKKTQELAQKIEAVQTATNLLDAGILSKKYIYREMLGFTDEEIQNIEKEIAADRKNKENLEPVFNVQQTSIGSAISSREDKGETKEGDKETEVETNVEAD